MTDILIHGVPIVHWNPRMRMFRGKLGDYLKKPTRTNNFGDMITPLLVERLLAAHATADGGPVQATGDTRMLGIGSIMHFASDGDVVWGTGINGKTPETSYKASRLDVRAVRGPKTRERLALRGIEAPAVYGDPALLLPTVLPELRAWAGDPRFDVAVVPNLNDYQAGERHPGTINPRAPLMTILERIARSRFVVGSSLHGIIVAESLGIPARLVVPEREHLFKYEDYYAGTGRSGVNAARDVEQALADGSGSPGMKWDPSPLLAAFPYDLWAKPVSV